MGGAQVMKRIPRIKFPQRHPKTSGSTSKPQAPSMTGNAHQTSISRSAQTSTIVGGKASLQPKRKPVSEEEIEAILMGGCF